MKSKVLETKLMNIGCLLDLNESSLNHNRGYDKVVRKSKIGMINLVHDWRAIQWFFTDNEAMVSKLVKTERELSQRADREGELVS